MTNTTRSLVSALSCRRRKPGGFYLTVEQRQETQEYADDSALRPAALEASEGRNADADLATMVESRGLVD